MYQQSFVSRRQRYLLGWAPFVALGVVAAASSCAKLEPFPATLTSSSGATGGGSGSSASGASAQSGSSASSASASGTTAGGATGPSGTCLATGASIASNVANAMELMHGQPSGCPGQANLTNIFTTPGVSMQAKGILFRDGPRGVCLAANLPPQKSGYSTVFPVASSRGASFDMALEQTIGEDTGDEVVASGHTEILAPVINTLRHPAWGRAQETYGEDSYHLGRMGSAYVVGAQQYVPACAKHFAANNVDRGRQSNTAVMDEQTLHEIYGRHFEMTIQDAGVACVMASYNLVQVTDGPDTTAHHSTQSAELLTSMLRNTFGFKGFVISDWWALPGDNASCSASPAFQAQTSALAVNAGLDIEMPWDSNYSQLQQDLTNNAVTQQTLKSAATYIASTQCQFNILNPMTGNGLAAATTTQDPSTFNIKGNTKHIQDARQAAAEGAVLLKNAVVSGVPTLPIPKTVQTIAVIGATVPFNLTNTDISSGTVNFITSAMSGYQSPTFLTGDLGSSRAYPDPTQFVGPLLGITNGAPTGTKIVSGASPTALVDSTGAAYAGTVDFYVVVAGDTPEDEGEDYTGASDRYSFSLDDKLVHVEGGVPTQDPLIEAVAALNKPMVVVLEGGSVIDMPWLSAVPAVVMTWYPGQDGGDALADLLFGKINFSGKLPTTWPNALTGGCSTTACPMTGTCEACFGDEPLFTVGAARATPMSYYHGYRYYDQNKITPLFAFGHGLSYTTYSYGTPTLSKATAAPTDTVTITVPVTNMGTVAGNEVSFAFVSYPNTTRGAKAHSNVKELKGFSRTLIPVGTTPTMVTIPLRISDLKYWDTPTAKWVGETGTINIMVGGSSDTLGTPITLTIQ